MPLVQTAKKIAEEKMKQQASEEKPKQEKNKYSDYNNPPKEISGEFPGDYSDRLNEWEKNLSPEDKMKLRQKRAQENNINLDR